MCTKHDKPSAVTLQIQCGYCIGVSIDIGISVEDVSI
jgi:hypothetical protein